MTIAGCRRFGRTEFKEIFSLYQYRSLQDDSGVTVEVIGFGLAGACVALRLQERGVRVRVVDDGLAGSTLVAAGLVNPVAGRNFEPSSRVQDAWDEAEAFYCDLDVTLWHPLPIKRLWRDEKDRAKFERKREIVSPWIESVDEEGVTWNQGGWLETARFLTIARERFCKNGGIISRAQDEMDQRIWCTGSAGLIRGEFGEVGHRCAKGEILTVKICDWNEKRILTKNGWLIPLGGDLYRVGATYDWDGLETGPSDDGRARVEKILRGFTQRDFEVMDHVAGVRPIIHRSEAVILFQEEKGWMLNGLGSKGVIYAPSVARDLVEKVISEAELSG
jgi:glycine oxidase|tara:strand:+ start:4905 stop:5903 length:999 start_codon:yes stop_codon:yes gene_type:complete